LKSRRCVLRRTRRSPLLGSIQPPASRSLQRASTSRRGRRRLSRILRKEPSTSQVPRPEPWSCLPCRLALTSPEARQSSQGPTVHSRSCLGNRGTLDVPLVASLRRLVTEPFQDWHYGHSKIIARKRRLRSPARSGSSMELSWRCHPRRPTEAHASCSSRRPTLATSRALPR
jgi:hypothetical protein